MLFLIHELIGNLNLQKQTRRIDLLRGARLFVFASLNQIGTIAWTVERYFALLTATLRTNSSVNSGAEALFFATFTDGATQVKLLDECRLNAGYHAGAHNRPTPAFAHAGSPVEMPRSAFANYKTPV